VTVIFAEWELEKRGEEKKITWQADGFVFWRLCLWDSKVVLENVL
jgi:hypothetical protein